LTQASSFDESLKSSVEGKTRNVDMTVGDIYGGDYASLGLPADMTASFFAKFTARDNEHLRDNVSDSDICRGLLLMITNNIGQISYLLARLHSVSHIFFSGSFLRHSVNVPLAPIALSKAISFWYSSLIQYILCHIHFR
jgi:type II pantothenate kinase